MLKKNLAWVTDSTASFSAEDKEWLKEKNIYVVPLSVSFGEETFKEEVDITIEEFYNKMKDFDGEVRTSQPALGDFINLYEQLKEEYDEIIAIHASSKLSGTYSSSVQAANIVGIPIIAIDSWCGSFPLKYIIIEGIHLYEQGCSTSEIVDKINKLREKINLMILPSNLDQLRKSGRVSNFGSILGNLLQIKPILAFSEGSVNITDKVRTSKKAEDLLINKFSDSVNSKGVQSNIAILYAGEIKKAQEFKDKLLSKFPKSSIELLPLIPVAGVHTGVGTIALSWVSK